MKAFQMLVVIIFASTIQEVSLASVERGEISCLQEVQGQLDALMKRQEQQAGIIYELQHRTEHQEKRIQILERDNRHHISEKQHLKDEIESIHAVFGQSEVKPHIDDNSELFRTNSTDNYNRSAEKIHGTSSKKQMSVPSSRIKERLLTDVDHPVQDYVAFYAYLSKDEPSPGRHHTFIFDIVKTNVGSGYNKHDGIFTAPSTGTYVFSWSVVSDFHGYIYSEIMVNSTPFGSILTNGQDITDDHTVTGIVVATLNQGYVVYIRTNPKMSIVGKILSADYRRTTFSGWKIF